MEINLANLKQEAETIRNNAAHDTYDIGRLVSIDDLLDAVPEDANLIEDCDFEDYARDIAESCGYAKFDNPLSAYIDWAGWANDVQMDYKSIVFDGDTYYYRE